MTASETSTLDTRGHVYAPTGKPDGSWTVWHWSDLDPFTQGYVEALFASIGRAGRCPVCFGSGEVIRYKRPPMGVTCGQCDGDGKKAPKFSDLAPETLGAILRGCEALQAQWPAERTEDGHRAVGREAWGRRASAYGLSPLTPYLGDDGKVYLREAGQ